MQIILDTNVWRRINNQNYLNLRSKLENKDIDIFLSETVFTLEAVQKKSSNGNVGRLEFFQNIKDNDFKLNSYLTDALELTRDLGIKILKTPRIGMPFNIDLPKDIFFSDKDTHDRMNKMGCICRAFPNAGYEYFKTYIQNLNLPEPWQTNLENIPSSEEDAFAKAIAEWADGDTVSACYGYSIDYLCTADNARNAGSQSIFSDVNKAKLLSDYELKTVSPSGLEEIL